MAAHSVVCWLVGKKLFFRCLTHVAAARVRELCYVLSTEPLQETRLLPRWWSFVYLNNEINFENVWKQALETVQVPLHEKKMIGQPNSLIPVGQTSEHHAGNTRQPCRMHITAHNMIGIVMRPIAPHDAAQDITAFVVTVQRRCQNPVGCCVFSLADPPSCTRWWQTIQLDCRMSVEYVDTKLSGIHAMPGVHTRHRSCSNPSINLPNNDQRKERKYLTHNTCPA